jgi:hypothetical protein
MTSRISRLVKQTGLNLTLARGRKPRILPMSPEDERINREIHRRREERLRKQRELASCPSPN